MSLYPRMLCHVFWSQVEYKIVCFIFDIFEGKECCPANLHNKPISCLMYADDLLILPETEDGLTECLQRLNRYNHEWKMTISTKKTKIMIFKVYTFLKCIWHQIFDITIFAKS